MKETREEYLKKYRQSHRSKTKKYNKEYYQQNKEYIKNCRLTKKQNKKV